jgi:hypothetical protein
VLVPLPRLPEAADLEQPLGMGEATLLGFADLGVEDRYQLELDLGQGHVADGGGEAGQPLPLAQRRRVDLELGREFPLGSGAPGRGRQG